MAQVDVTLNSEKREQLGKSAANRVREADKLPAVVYGPDLKENISVSVDYKEFEKIFKACGKHKVFAIKTGAKSVDVMIKEFKIHPITRRFEHVDFFAVNTKKPFATEVPINYTGNPVGVKEGGGLYTYQRKLKITTDLANLPEGIDVDIANLKINQYLTVRDVVKKSDYTILTNEGTLLVEIK
jgi:large subunit ribosomal protein L25